MSAILVNLMIAILFDTSGSLVLTVAIFGMGSFLTSSKLFVVVVSASMVDETFLLFASFELRSFFRKFSLRLNSLNSFS